MRNGDRGRNDEDLLYQRYGPMIGGAELAHVMGFRNTAALRQARRRGKIDVRTFRIAGRRGLFALTLDVSDWLARAADVSALRKSASLDQDDE